MFALLANPWLILGVLLALSSAFGGGYWKGHHDEYLKQQAEIARLNEQAREIERKNTEEVNNYATKLARANREAQEKIEQLRSDVDAGAVSLRIKTNSPVCAPTDAASATGNRGEATAELDRETSKTLVAITADGDAAIRQLNACIDIYNKVRNRK